MPQTNGEGESTVPVSLNPEAILEVFVKNRKMGLRLTLGPQVHDVHLHPREARRLAKNLRRIADAIS